MASSRSMNAPPYFPECEILEEGGSSPETLSRKCGCRDQFIPVDGMTINHLPEWARDGESLKSIKSLCDLTVCIKTKHTSTNRPNTYPDSTAPYPYAKFKGSQKVTRCGTGYILSSTFKKITGKCPCPDCGKLGFLKKKFRYFIVKVRTASHVVFDTLEAEKTICEMFYDSPSKEGVKYLYGIAGEPGYDEDESFVGRSIDDVFDMTCASHDLELYKRLKAMLDRDWNMTLPFNRPFIASHPHGFSKRVSFGTARYVSIELSDKHTPNTFYNLPVDTEIETKTDVDSLYPGHFRVSPSSTRTGLVGISNIICDASQCVDFCLECSNSDFLLLPKGCRVTDWLQETEIHLEEFRMRFETLYETLNGKSYHFKYDTPTCGGSSGARVITPVGGECHFGKMMDGMNRSGYLKRWWHHW